MIKASPSTGNAVPVGVSWSAAKNTVTVHANKAKRASGACEAKGARGAGETVFGDTESICASLMHATPAMPDLVG